MEGERIIIGVHCGLLASGWDILHFSWKRIRKSFCGFSGDSQYFHDGVGFEPLFQKHGGVSASLHKAAYLSGIFTVINSK
jgi:hypothetical protein